MTKTKNKNIELKKILHILIITVTLVGIVVYLGVILSKAATTQTWNFSNSGDYSYNSSSIEVSSNKTFLKTTSSIDSIDDDNSSNGFDGGTRNDTRWNNSKEWVVLTSTGKTNGLGNFESRIIDSKAEDTSWDKLAWITQSPASKELPDNRGIESGYFEGNIDMTGNALLLHMNESSGTVTDSSGSGNNGINTNATYGIVGKYNTGLDFDGSTSKILINGSPSLDVTNTATVEAWVKLRTHDSLIDPIITKGTDWDFAITGNGACSGTDNILGFFTSNGWRCANSTIPTGEWVHVAATFDLPSNVVTFYLNGQSDGTAAIINPMIVGGDLRIGKVKNNPYFFDGAMDEVALYNRVLSSTEISNRYKRGMIDLKYQIRSCDDVACSGESFTGPNGSPSTYFSELSNNTIYPPDFDLLNIPNNRYFQYKAFLENNDNFSTPKIKSVSISGTGFFDNKDSDNSPNGFGNGNFNKTRWDKTNKWIELNNVGMNNGSGVFRSRIMNAGSNLEWNKVHWSTQQPFLKELPSNQIIESAYNDGNIDMTGNTLLLHMNESSGNIMDSSGNGNHGINNGATYGLDGIYNTALSFDGSNSYVDMGTGQISNIYTWTGWVNPGDLSNTSFFFGNFNLAGTHDSLTLKTRDNGKFQVQSQDQNGVYQRTASTTIASENNWYYVTAVRSSGSNLSIYINGVLENTDTTVVSNTLYQNTGNISLGRSGDYNNQNRYFNGLLDEVAMFNRALSPTEIMDHYRRGANRLKLQIRSCDDDQCSGENFVGPDGTNGSYYTELMNSNNTYPSLSLTNIPDNQYIQYKAFLETNNNTLSPELLSVEIEPLRYPGDYPTIESNTGTNYVSLSGFSHTMGSNNQGNVTYQVSNDGINWYYHGPSGWTQETGAGYPTETNTVNEVDSMINSFNKDGIFYFRAFLISNGTQKVELDKINLEYSNTPPPPPSAHTIKNQETEEIQEIEEIEEITKETTTFEECVEAGYTIIEGFPRRCIIGEIFTENIKDILEEEKKETKEEAQEIKEEIQKETKEYYYIVQSGDSLRSIANKFSITSTDLIELNKNTYPRLTTNPNIINVGWRLIYDIEKIHNGSVTKSYAVQPGDNLGSIANRLNTTRDSIIKKNLNKYPTLGLNPNIISVGWELIY